MPIQLRIFIRAVQEPVHTPGRPRLLICPFEVILPRQVDVLMTQGRQASDAVQTIDVTEYGGLKGDQVKQLKELEIENNRLRRAATNLTLAKLIPAETAKGNF